MSEGAVDLTGRQIGNWELLRLLGEGAFGGVYEAQNTGIAGRRAAIKILHPHMSLNSDIKRRFVNEASAASRAEHENIIQVFDGGVTPDGICYAVMELLKGRPLSKVIAEGRLDVRRTINIGVQVASALRAAHNLGIVHRDLKPDNIFVVTRESNLEFVKVLDFGIAKLAAELNGGAATQTGMLLGTPGYMSPEQWQTLPDIDGRADVYALGTILFECLTQQLPFSANTVYEWLDAHINRAAPDPASVAPEAAPLSKLILSMLAKDRAARPQEMAEVIRLLENVRAPSAPLPAATPPWHSGNTFLPTPSTNIGKPPPKKRAPLFAGIGIAVAVAGGIGAWLTFHKTDEPPKKVETAHLDPAPPVAAEGPEAPRAPLGMVALPGGSLSVGRADYGRPGALDVPEHSVTVKPFAIQLAEVTAADYKEFADQTKAAWPHGAHSGKTPISGVAFSDAENYCKWRFNNGGRLPSEAEWEWAARGASGRLYPWGNEMKKECVNAFKGEHGALSAPDSRRCGATPEGILDLSGSLWEWTTSAAAFYPGAPNTAAPPGYRVVRGGSYFNTDNNDLTATARQFVNAPNKYLGFRCVAEIK
jgi:serine/threonine-protein kinase